MKRLLRTIAPQPVGPNPHLLQPASGIETIRSNVALSENPAGTFDSSQLYGTGPNMYAATHSQSRVSPNRGTVQTHAQAITAQHAPAQQHRRPTRNVIVLSAGVLMLLAGLALMLFIRAEQDPSKDRLEQQKQDQTRALLGGLLTGLGIAIVAFSFWKSR